MAPSYNLGPCEDCCPPCDYSVLVRVEHYTNGNNVVTVYFYNAGVLDFFSVGYPTTIDETNGYFSATLLNGATADYSAGSVVVTYGGQTITFSNLTTSSGTTESGVKWWEISSNNCVES